MPIVKNSKLITLTAKEFIDAWIGGYKGVKKEDGKGYYEYNSPYDTSIEVVFQNIEVKESIFIDGIIDFAEKLPKLPHLMLDLSFIKGLVLENLSAKNIQIQNTAVDDFVVDNVESEDIEIRDAIFENIKIASSQIEDLILVNTTLHNLTIDSHSNFKSRLFIDKCTIHGVGIGSQELRKIDIVYSYLQFFSWMQNTICVFTMAECKVESFIFHMAIIPKDSVFRISNTKIKTLMCVELTNTAWLNISGLKPLNNYNRFDENEEGEAIIKNGKYNLIPVTNQTTTLHFENSDFGKTSFVNCDLNEFDEFIFYNTKMLEVFVAGTELPKNSKKFELPDGINDDKKYDQQRLAYSQFKKISDNRGDNVQATEFLALEMDAYAKQLLFNLRKKPLKLDELLNIGLNKMSSNHGNSWVWAVFVTLMVNSLCFWLYCHSLGYVRGNDKDLFYKLASYSLEFLNPLRRSDFLQAEITPFARIVDYISRIIVAYFTYQTIQAFRRFGKR